LPACAMSGITLIDIGKLRFLRGNAALRAKATEY
jgi:hypothetical protein